MDNDLFLLIADLADDELAVGHEHRATPYPCTTIRLEAEDNNMGDEAFVRLDAYL
jgi:hypothetical protein